MKRYFSRFTLVEMLTVIAIISILAGIVIPVVIVAQESGRETETKSDITALLTALKQLDTDYGKMLKKSSSNYKIGDKNVSLSNSDVLSSSGTTSSGTNSLATIPAGTSANAQEVYDAMIAELSTPKNKEFTSSNPVSVNLRKKVYLEPKKGFDPTKEYNDENNLPYLWRDPWGNPYTVYIKITKDGIIKLPDTNKTIAADAAVYSFGPNGTDDKGCNKSLDGCIYTSDDANHRLHDDIASWNM